MARLKGMLIASVSNLLRISRELSSARILDPLTTSQQCCCAPFVSTRNNSNRSSIAKVGRKVYTRLYPTSLVLSNGATINVRYHEPRKVIQLPLDILTLSAEEQQARLMKRRPKTKVVVEEETDVDFDSSRYIKIGKKSR